MSVNALSLHCLDTKRRLNTLNMSFREIGHNSDEETRDEGGLVKTLKVLNLESRPMQTQSNAAILDELLERSGYSLEASPTYRRIFKTRSTSLSTATFAESQNDSTNQFQVYCGRIPGDVTEYELFGLFRRHGQLCEIRLILDAATQQPRGFAFAKFVDATAGKCAMSCMNNFEIRPGKHLKLSEYKPNRCLYIGNIPKLKDTLELREEIDRHLSGVINVITYRPVSNCRLHDQNRGFCFVEFASHENARGAKRKIERDQLKLWGCAIFVDWADYQDEPNESIMSCVKVLYVRNVSDSVTEDTLKLLFESFGRVERVKKIKDFAFIHFTERSDALKAMQMLHGAELDGERLKIVLSYPPLDKKKKEEMLRIRQDRIMRELPQRIRN